MKYSEIDLQCEDIMWFGVDRNGLIFECTSGGMGCVPAFVCDSRENTEILKKFFLQELPNSTPGTLLIRKDDNSLVKDCLSLSGKGIYCFDVAIEEDRLDEYKKVAVPSIPTKLTDLPVSIQEIMKNHIVNVDVEQESFIHMRMHISGYLKKPCYTKYEYNVTSPDASFRKHCCLKTAFF